VFWINIPICVLATTCIIVIFPGKYLHGKGRKVVFRQIDVPGIFLSLAATTFIVVPLQEGGTRFPWKSAIIIGMLAGAPVLLALFGFWENLLTAREKKWQMLPLFPTRLVKSRVMLACLGYDYTSATFQFYSFARSANTYAALSSSLAVHSL
jgi:hypothetical protein